MNMKEALAAAIKAAAVKAIAAGTIKEGDLPEVLLEVPPQKEFGDFATNAFFRFINLAPSVFICSLMSQLSSWKSPMLFATTQ